jgi:hypothetical protein
MFRLDSSRFPLVLVTASGEITERDVDRLDADFEHVFAHHRRFAIVTHSTIVRFPSTNVRERIAAWAKRPDVHAATSLLNVGHAYVVGNAIVRSSMAALLWLWDPPNPQFAAATYQEGVDWALVQLVETNAIDTHEALALRSTLISETA